MIINELDVHQLCRTRDNNVSLEGPKRLGYLSSSDSENNSAFSQDKLALRYLDFPDPVNIDCLQGYDPNVKYGHFISKDTLLLRWILENEETMQKFPSDFIGNNGVIKDLMTIKDYVYDWSLSAIKIRGKIILNRVESTEKKTRIDKQSESVNKSTYAAFNFPNLITKSKSEQEGTLFYGVFHSKIGSHRILHTGKLHYVESAQELDKPFDEMKFVSIRKMHVLGNCPSSIQANNWWSLATLSGIDTIVCAKCARDFTVAKIEKLRVDDLIDKHKQMIFVASLDSILDHLKSIVTEENQYYDFHFNGKEKKFIGCLKMDLEDNLIPSWYIDGQIPNGSC
uniref:Decapping nuclease n=1 Tax=Tetranychus urticae TaxID=32264 RepID=T1KUF6_TETUR